jgi:hypothetical protein
MVLVSSIGGMIPFVCASPFKKVPSKSLWGRAPSSNLLSAWMGVVELRTGYPSEI